MSKDLDRALLKTALRKAIYGLDNGVKVGERVRRFNLLDYYLLIKKATGSINLDFRECHNMGIISASQCERLQRFVTMRESSVIPAMTVNKLLEIKFMYGEWTMSMDEKMNIINTLKEEKLPVNNVTYVLAVHNYIMEEIMPKYKAPIVNDKKRTLKK